LKIKKDKTDNILELTLRGNTRNIISGSHTPAAMGNGEPKDYFEIEIGNEICYAAPMGSTAPASALDSK
jgi:hypothetical protein